MQIDDDGYVWFRQSWLGDYLLCPDRARKTAFNPPEAEYDGTDATALGTAVHEAIELFLVGMPMPDAIEQSGAAMAELWHSGAFKILKIKNLSTMLKQHKLCAESWLLHVYPSVGTPHPTEGAEHNFKHRITSEWGVKGTWDFKNEDDVLWDWKTAGGMWTQQYGPKGLEKKIQPTVYTAVQAGFVADDALVRHIRNGLALPDCFESNLPTIRFSYGILPKGNKHEGHVRTTERHIGHWLWLVKQVEAIMEMYKSLGPHVTWPLNDSEWLCSSEYCDHWNTCKGQLVHLPIKENIKSL
jgi:hypothetical protein